jgi:hypothetical protein
MTKVQTPQLRYFATSKKGLFDFHNLPPQNLATLHFAPLIFF